MALGIGGAKFSLGGVELESIPLPVSGSSADLTLMMAEDRGQLSGVLKYNATLFDSVTISRITSQFSSLLEVLATEREQKLSALPVSPAVDIQNMSTKRTTTVPIPSSNGPCIHQLVERMASEIPECPALIVNEQKITYAELNKRANRFARYLLKCGIQTESRVGIYLNRSVELIVAVLAIWKAGGAYVPFDTRDPRGRLAGLLARSAPEILITHDDLLQRLPDDLPTVILLNSDLDIIDQEADSNPNLSVSSANLAYIIHTSGSVGEPKGVLIEHRSVLNLLSGLKSRIYSNFDDRQLVVGLNASVAFDSSVKQLLVLGLGHTLCLVPEAARRSGDDLLRVAVSAGVDVLDCTPSQAELLIEAGLGVISSSLHLLLGGEPVTEAVWRELAKHESATCYNLYGPTECTVDTTICPIRANGPPSIGRPIDGVRVYLLDGDYQQVPDGIAGELFISGESVGRGYLGQPALTAARFLPDPFSPCGRMYRTGDIGRYSSNGTIRLIGRVDRQIKLRGFRIELDEVEAALKRIRGVRDAAVITWKAPNKTTHLIGYVVCDEERTSDQYKRLLSQMLPEYMIPVTMIHVTGIPLTSRAKRDYKALPIPDIARDEHSDDYAKPTSALEQELAALWVEQLQIDTISVDDSFFALGGDSLQAARLIGRIQQKYATDAPLLAQFFEEPTIAGLARAIALSGDSLMDNVHTNAD
jgi:amino acid adenylation domain-containing protein